MKKVLAAALLIMTLSTLSIAQRTLINKGDQYVGAKLALGSVAGASWGLIGNYEMGYQENIGIGATLGYSGYSEDFGFGTYSYTNILILVNGNYHMDVLKNEKLDTWAALNIGYNIASANIEWKGASVPNWTSPTVGGLVFGLSANARYQLTEQLYATGSLGFGLGILNIGIDYKL